MKEHKHQELIDELLTKLKKYDQVKEEKSELEGEMLELQRRLHDAGIDYKIQMGEVRLERFEKKTNVQLTYDLVMKTADEIMSQGRAVSSGMLVKKLGLNNNYKSKIESLLRQASIAGKYDAEKETTYAFPRKFSVYYPRKRHLPFLPDNITLLEYSEAVKIGKKALSSIHKKKFSQKEFYTELKSVDGKMKSRKIMISVPAILRDYVHKGILETKDMNIYKKI